MRKHLRYIGISGVVAIVSLLIGHAALGQNRDIGFSDRFGGPAEEREIQIAIMNHTATTAEKIQHVVEQMGTVDGELGRIQVAVQAMQRGMDQQTLELSRQNELMKEQQALLVQVVRALTKQQQTSMLLLEENRKMRQILEMQPVPSSR